MNIQALNEATAFIWQEADLLDHRDYAGWLTLWAAAGRYVIPIDPVATDFENTLNYIYDDGEMRAKRVERLTGGKSISTTPAPRTVRSVSRLRLLGDAGGVLTVRCAQDLREFRKNVLRQHTADVTYELQRSGEGLLMRSKVVRLVNSTDTLHSIGFIL